MLLFPVAVDVPMQRYPIANWVIMAVTTLYSVSLFHGSDPPWIPAGYWKLDPMFGKELFLSMFAHADYVHLIGNMIFLWVFGNAVNAKLGNTLYVAFYLACGIVAGIAWKLMGSGEVSIGASGAIMGAVGAHLVFFPTNTVSVFYWIFFRAGTFSVSSLIVVSIYVLLDVLGFMNDSSGTAHIAHLGGFALGFAAILALVLAGRFSPTRYEKNLPQVMGMHKYDSRPMPIGFRD
ncbi:MAG: rhomboid family intramembrane serine protease [Phycisphaerales bacterium JB065]